MNECLLGQRGCPGWGLIHEPTCGLTKVCMYVCYVYSDFYSETTIMWVNVYRRVCAQVSLWHEYDGEHLPSFVQSHWFQGYWVGTYQMTSSNSDRQAGQCAACGCYRKKKLLRALCVLQLFIFTFRINHIHHIIEWIFLTFVHLTVVGSDVFFFSDIFHTKVVLTVHNFLCLVAIWHAWTWLLLSFFSSVPSRGAKRGNWKYPPSVNLSVQPCVLWAW